MSRASRGEEKVIVMSSLLVMDWRPGKSAIFCLGSKAAEGEEASFYGMILVSFVLTSRCESWIC